MIKEGKFGIVLRSHTMKDGFVLYVLPNSVTSSELKKNADKSTFFFGFPLVN